MSNKISVITVVYNDVNNIRQTIESFFSQKWEDKEYIIIDGGSTDGTADIIKEYESRIAFWCSEPDNGIYDALNKGINHCKGEWINVLNSGDYYATNESLSYFFDSPEASEADVIYGDSLEYEDGARRLIVSSDNKNLMNYHPIYRHGSSIVRTSVHRKFMFELSKSSKFKYALDWDVIYRMYKSGCKFTRTPRIIQAYKKEGTSNNPLKTVILNHKIVTQDGTSVKKLFNAFKKLIITILVMSGIYNFIRSIVLEYAVNSIIPHIPFWSIRKTYLKMIGMKLGKRSFIMKRNYIMNANLVSMGEHCHINRGCTIDARGTITLGNNVSISFNTMLFTAGHDYQSKDFCYETKPIIIEDNVWIGAGCTILPGVRIGKGAVICSGAVVTKDVPEYNVMAGIPARKIKERTHDLSYECNGYLFLT